MVWLWNGFVIFSDFIEHHIGAITAVIAAAAVIQWRETRRTAERQLRAYIFNSNASLYDGASLSPKPVVDRTDQVGIALAIKNYGQTPGSKVMHWAEMQISPINREVSVKPPDKLDGTSPITLGPGAESTKFLWLNRALSTQEKEGIRSGTYAIYLYGRIEYFDAFGYSRWSTYKLRYTNSAWPPIAHPGGMTFCDTGNDHK